MNGIKLYICGGCGKATPRALCHMCTNPKGVQLLQDGQVTVTDKMNNEYIVVRPDYNEPPKRIAKKLTLKDAEITLKDCFNPHIIFYCFRVWLGYLILPSTYKKYIKLFHEEIYKSLEK